MAHYRTEIRCAALIAATLLVASSTNAQSLKDLLNKELSKRGKEQTSQSQAQTKDSTSAAANESLTPKQYKSKLSEELWNVNREVTAYFGNAHNENNAKNAIKSFQSTIARADSYGLKDNDTLVFDPDKENSPSANVAVLKKYADDLNGLMARIKANHAVLEDLPKFKQKQAEDVAADLGLTEFHVLSPKGDKRLGDTFAQSLSAKLEKLKGQQVPGDLLLEQTSLMLSSKFGDSSQALGYAPFSERMITVAELIDRAEAATKRSRGAAKEGQAEQRAKLAPYLKVLSGDKAAKFEKWNYQTVSGFNLGRYYGPGQKTLESPQDFANASFWAEPVYHKDTIPNTWELRIHRFNGNKYLRTDTKTGVGLTIPSSAYN